MKQKLYILFFLLLAFQQLSQGQQETYTVTKAPFSSDKYDEYSPVFYRNGIVFTSNRGSGSLVDYSGSTGKSTFDISYIDTTKKVTWRKTETFSGSLKTAFNEGPVTFNSTGDTIYYTRNLQVDGSFAELSNARNKLGIFTATYDGKRWTRIREMRFNNEWYNSISPCLSPDGKRLYFASDKPGGYGGTDLYYSELTDGYWNEPVNMGPVINTPGNESYPFINQAGEIYFASDGHPGLGAKDIFFSRFSNNGWLQPVHLDAPINSQYDDFGFIIDSALNTGYFSSSRGITMDIYSFKTIMPQIFYSDPQMENYYCFVFSDEGIIKADKSILGYDWSFGDGSKGSGEGVTHCFPGPGRYMVKLCLTDKKTGNEVITKAVYELNLKDIQQPYITSPDAVAIGEEVLFDSRNSNLPGFEITSYTWQINNERRINGSAINYTFKEKGVQEVKLALKARNINTGIVSQKSILKKISVFNTKKEASDYLAKLKDPQSIENIVAAYENGSVKQIYSADEEVSQDAEFIVEVMTSKTRLANNNIIFKKIPPRYKVKEVFLPDEDLYSYIVDREMEFTLTLPAYYDMVSLGFRNTRVRTLVLKDTAEKEVYNLKKIFGLSSDTYIDNYNKLTSNGYLFLDQVTALLTRYPDIRFELEIHTDNSGSPENNMIITQRRVQLMLNYLISKGIDPKRLSGKGFGGTRPVASNSSESGRKQNRRIDYSIHRP